MIFFSSAPTAAPKWTRWYCKQTRQKMPAVRDQTDQEIS